MSIGDFIPAARVAMGIKTLLITHQYLALPILLVGRTVMILVPLIFLDFKQIFDDVFGSRLSCDWLLSCFDTSKL